MNEWRKKLTVHICDSNPDYCPASSPTTTPVPDVSWERDAGERKATDWSVKTCVRNWFGSSLRLVIALVVLTSTMSCWSVVMTGRDFENRMPPSTSKACAMRLQSSPDSTSGRHIVWRERGKVRVASSLRSEKFSKQFKRTNCWAVRKIHEHYSPFSLSNFSLPRFRCRFFTVIMATVKSAITTPAFTSFVHCMRFHIAFKRERTRDL